VIHLSYIGSFLGTENVMAGHFQIVVLGQKDRIEIGSGRMAEEERRSLGSVGNTD
jgi:hypothetical protein